MYIPLQNSFRKDLIITQTTNPEDSTKTYLIKDPISEETFEFGEAEYFLCQSMDGTSTPAEIVANFQASYGHVMTEEDFNNYSGQIFEFGLLESSKIPVSIAASVAFEKTQDLAHTSNHSPTIKEQPEIPSQPSQKKDDHNLESEYKQPSKKTKKGPIYLWTLPNPAPKFAKIAAFVNPFNYIFLLSVWALIPGLPIAFFTFF